MWAGKAFAWCILIMTFGTAYEVFVRYVLRSPTSWAFDISYMMYGTLFMMAGAYTLSRGGHVRGDMLYRLWKPVTQAKVEFVLYFLFFFPGVIALMFAGWKYAARSWSYNNGWGEVSVMSPANVPISQFKTVIAVAGALLFLQGLAQVCRCIICMRTGEWPQQSEDIEELEDQLRKQHGGDALRAYSEAVDVVQPMPQARDAADTRAQAPRATSVPSTRRKKSPARKTASGTGAGKPRALKQARKGGADDLKVISGIGPKLEKTLNGLGVYHYDQIAMWNRKNVEWIDGYLNFKGRIDRDGWIKQAKQLARKRGDKS